ncbi:imidazolonepropionase [Parasalinivibrio latis]|uniref:imidazolonepropionase n=1 Tax=Parasalinivibrio latis TaxID=2952610 RepID=UPI0030E5CE49
MEWVLKNCRLVTMNPTDTDLGYTPVDAAWIHICDGHIVAIGQGEPNTSLPSLDAQSKLVTPGLIDSHTHLVYAGNRANEFEQRLSGIPYSTIAKNGGGILSTVKATRNASENELIDISLPRIGALIRDGVTTVEIKSGYGLTLKDELKMLRAAKALGNLAPVRVTTTLLAAHALPPEYSNRADAYISYIVDEIIPAAAEEKLADAVDVFCENIAFSCEHMARVFGAAKKHNLKIKGHTEQLSNMGGSKLAAEMGACSVDHIEYLDEDGVKAMAENGTVGTLLPGAYFFLRETQKPPVDLLRHYNVPMAIATDFNPGTSPYASVTLMMNMACTQFGLTPCEAIQGTTVNAAKALGLSNIGFLAPGMAADICVWDLEDPASISYQFGLGVLRHRIFHGEYTHD